MVVTTVYITRHGETVWNVEGRLQGRGDSPLTERGRRQAGWLAEALGSVALDAIYSSPSGRAVRTAEIVGRGRGVPVTPRDDLREIGMGDWEGELEREVQLRDPEQFAAFWETPHLYRPVNGGESFEDLERRVAGALDAILARHKGQEGQTVLIVTHTAALKAMLAEVEGRPLARLWDPPFIAPTALCKLVIAEGARTRALELYGDTTHYREDEAVG